MAAPHDNLDHWPQLGAGPTDPDIADHLDDYTNERDGTERIDPDGPIKFKNTGPVHEGHIVDVNDSLRYQMALKARAAGKSYKQVAEECGFLNEKAAARAVRYMLRKMGHEPSVDMIRLEQARLDALLEAWWPAATGTWVDVKGNQQSPDPQAAAIILKIMDRRDRLYGYNQSPPLAAKQEDASQREKPIEQLSTDQRLDRLNQILDAARARRDRQDTKP